MRTDVIAPRLRLSSGDAITGLTLIARGDWPVGRILFTEKTVGVGILMPRDADNISVENCTVIGFGDYGFEVR